MGETVGALDQLGAVAVDTNDAGEPTCRSKAIELTTQVVHVRRLFARLIRSNTDIYYPDMRLSEGVEWTLHCCSILGALPPQSTISGSRLAEFHGVPAPYLVKQLQKLSQAGIVATAVGRTGGYRLARPAGEISLLEVVTALEGDDHAFRCTEIRQQGPTAEARKYIRPCGIARAMWRAEDAWRAELAAVTIADINAELARTGDPKQIRRAIDWLKETQ